MSWVRLNPFNLNEEETFRLKGFNRQNEVEFAVADEEGYTQGIGLSYRVDFDNGKELKEKIFGKRKKEPKKKQVDSLKIKSGLVNFVKAKKDTVSASKKKRSETIIRNTPRKRYRIISYR